MDLSRYEFSFFCLYRPSRPISRTPGFHSYFAFLGRDVNVPYRGLPTELWENILKHLPTEDLKSLCLVSNHVGIFARDQLGRRMRSMKATGAVFYAFFSSRSPLGGVPSYALRLRSLTLTLSPHCHYATPSSNDILEYWAQVSRHLNHLVELSFLGTDVRYNGCRDLLEGLPHTARLRRFFCEDGRILRDLMPSLFNHEETLEDFGGFFDTAVVSPLKTADTFLYQFSNVRTLEVGWEFIHGLRNAGSVVNLSVRLEWTEMLPCVRSLSMAFENQLRALRLDRKGVVDCYRVLDDPNLALEPEWAQSPLFLCGHLDIPSLRYLEVRDTAPPLPLPVRAYPTPLWMSLTGVCRARLLCLPVHRYSRIAPGPLGATTAASLSSNASRGGLHGPRKAHFCAPARTLLCARLRVCFPC